eukprot:m51a1_g1210 putative two pore calcium channel protein 1-like (1045) ;mRNA; f:474797-478313
MRGLFPDVRFLWATRFHRPSHMARVIANQVAKAEEQEEQQQEQFQQQQQQQSSASSELSPPPTAAGSAILVTPPRESSEEADGGRQQQAAAGLLPARGVDEAAASRLRYLQASALIEDALAFRPVTHDLSSENSLRFYRFFWRKNPQRVLNLLVVVLLKTAAGSSADAASEDGTSLQAPWPATEAIELFILLALVVGDIVPRWAYTLPGMWRRKAQLWFIAYIAVVGLSVVDVVTTFFVHRVDPHSGYFRFSRPLRIYLLVFRVEPLRVTLGNIVGSFLGVLHMFGLFFVLVFIFAGLGVLLFDETPEEKVVFTSTLEGAFQLLLLTTTCNHPDVYVPAYNYNWASFLFFVLYSTVSQLFFLNLMLSVIVSSWRNLLKADVARKMILRREAMRGAFAVMSQGSNYVTREEFLKLARVFKPAWKEGRAAFYWNAVDTAKAGRVEFAEFSLLIEALEITVERISKFWRVIPLRLSKNLRKVTKARAFNVAIDLIIIAVSVWPIVEVEMRHAGHKTMSKSVSTGIEYGFLVFFTIEVFAKFIAERSLSLFFENPTNKFDVVLLAISWVMGIGSEILGGTGSLVKMVLSVRLLRVLVSLIGSVKKYKWLLNALIDVIPTFASILLAHIVWMYLFSILGIEIFGDVVREAHAAGIDKGYGLVADTDYAKLDYWRIGYGSFPEALVATWMLVIVNNWHVLMQAYVVATGYKISRLFFVCFWIIDVICTMGVLIATLLEMVMRHWDDKGTLDERQVTAEKRLNESVHETDDQGFYFSDSKKKRPSIAGLQPESCIEESDSDVPRDSQEPSVKFGDMSPELGKIEEATTWVSRRTKQFTSMMQRMVLQDLNESDFAKESHTDDMIAGLESVYKVYSKPSLGVAEKELPSRLSISVPRPPQPGGSSSGESPSIEVAAAAAALPSSPLDAFDKAPAAASDNGEEGSSKDRKNILLNIPISKPRLRTSFDAGPRASRVSFSQSRTAAQPDDYSRPRHSICLARPEATAPHKRKKLGLELAVPQLAVAPTAAAAPWIARQGAAVHQSCPKHCPRSP